LKTAIVLSRARVITLVLLVSVYLASFTSIPIVEAATFDGTYDYAYNYYDSRRKSGERWVSVSIPSGFIVKNGRISSNPSGLSGWVDSNGNVRFTGPCPYGGHQTVFTGSIGTNGKGGGYYRCGYSGHPNPGGRWSVNRVSSSGIFGFIDDLLGSTEAIAMVAVVGGLSIAAIGIWNIERKGSGEERLRKPGPPTQTQQPAPPSISYDSSPYQVDTPSPQTSPSSTTHEIPPSTIGVPSPPTSPEAGVTLSHPPPSQLDLNAVWFSNRVNLSWQKPQFDPSIYTLQGYDVYRIQYTGASTVPTKIHIGTLNPGSTGTTVSHTQTYTYNTSGDTAGYVVEARLGYTSSTGHSQVYRVSNMAYTPYPPS
jgi:hypothetical protein